MTNNHSKPALPVIVFYRINSVDHGILKTTMVPISIYFSLGLRQKHGIVVGESSDELYHFKPDLPNSGLSTSPKGIQSK